MDDWVMTGGCSYSCESAAQTLEWIAAIIDFIKPYTFLLDAHVVNFFKDRLWEAVDKEWINCLRQEPVENLLRIPSGLVQDHWPASLKEFIFTLRSLVFPREQVELQKAFPDLILHPLEKVLTQGMIPKKRHEVEVLSAVVSSVARSVGSHIIVDVGAGQGYLAQVLSFQYRLSVVAIDASSHHGKIIDARAERIKKHYAAKMLKPSYRSEDGMYDLDGPKVVTCRVLSGDALNVLSDSLLQHDVVEKPKLIDRCLGEPFYDGNNPRKSPSSCSTASRSSFLLAGLHACGDLSVTMIRSFTECEEAEALISIGCCYNLLSEDGFGHAGSQFGFPMSKGVKSYGLSLGKSSLDLACQSAERWRSLRKDSGLKNFELHAFRASFQMLLYRYYPEVLIKCPAIGRQGKALRRKQQRRNLESSNYQEESEHSPFPEKQCKKKGSCPAVNLTCSASDGGSLLDAGASSNEFHFGGSKSVDRYSFFEIFSQSALSRLGLIPLQDLDTLQIWRETEPFLELIGPYWSLRAALGPVIETLLLLDRLLFLQEEGSSLEATMVPIFDPALSPRNVAIIAKKTRWPTS